MKSLLYQVLGALGGLVFCIASLRLSQAVGLTVAFPAFAGETDFAFREKLFVFGLLPLFFVFGGYVGDAFRRNFWCSVMLIFGAAVGVSVHFVGWHALLDTLQALGSRSAANTAAGLYFASWSGLPVLFALAARRIYQRTRQTASR